MSGSGGTGRSIMTNEIAIRTASIEQLTELLYAWRSRCTIRCPAIGYCKTGSCHDAIRQWLHADREEGLTIGSDYQGGEGQNDEVQATSEQGD